MDISTYMEKNGHEGLSFFRDAHSGLKAVMAIHDTTLGPAMGPPKIASYASEDDAVLEALRFSYNHTYKNAMADLPFGGGRIIVMGDSAHAKTEALVRSLGRFIESMCGRYVITGGGSGFNDDDTELLLQETRHIIGLPVHHGGSGDSGIMAGYGVYHGLKACALEVFGTDALAGKTIAISGLGKVGSALAENVLKEGASLIVSDVRKPALTKWKERYGALIVDPGEIFDVQCDILSPCSVSNFLNHRNIKRLKCKIVGGAANNQLADQQKDAEALQQRGILLAPEFVINAGGIINFYAEIGGYKPELARSKTENIHTVLSSVFSKAKLEKITPVEAAYALAKEKIDQASGLRGVNQGMSRHRPADGMRS
ncbi:MAG: Glu/Leu/Phe/Val dehydrogenase [Desulfobacteraceae bacterium]|nr:Glu/Leu/Phe/Val dehydrogenase [Desulfobacteraceae bacterium]